MLRRVPCGALKAKPVAYEAPLTALGKVLQPVHCRVEFLGMILIHNELYACRSGEFVNKACFFVCTLSKFRLRRNVGVIVKHGYIKIACEIFKAITAARRAATVQQKGRTLAVQRGYQLIEFLLIIYFVHDIFNMGLSVLPGSPVIYFYDFSVSRSRSSDDTS